MYSACSRYIAICFSWSSNPHLLYTSAMFGASLHPPAYGVYCTVSESKPAGAERIHTTLMSASCSRTVTLCPARLSAMAVVRPAMPAPMMTTWIGRKSGVLEIVVWFCELSEYHV